MIEIESINQKFSSAYFFHGKKLLELGRVSPSFFKSSIPQFIIISGIIDENNTKYESKISLKATDTDKKFTTQCTCKLWNENDFCPHVVALWLKCVDLLQSEDKIPYSLGTSYSSNEGVTALKFGTIIKAAPQLNGAKMNSTFTSLYYNLTNGKNIPFGAPKVSSGKIIFNFQSSSEDVDLVPLTTGPRHFSYWVSYQNSELEEIKEVSILDTHYLINWKTGDFHQLTFDQIELIKKLKQTSAPIDIDEYLKIAKPFLAKPSLDIRVNNIPLNDLIPKEMKWVFFVEESERKAFLKIKLQFTNTDSYILSPPIFLNLFSSEGTWLSSFRQKNESNSFLSVLIKDFEESTQLYTKYIHSASKKATITDWIEPILNGEDILHFEPEINELYSLNTSLLKKMISILDESFQGHAFKSSFFHAQEKNVSFFIPKNFLMDGLSRLYQFLTPLEIPLYYKDQIIKSWKNTIRFERQNLNVDWFEIDLLVSQGDLEIIKNSDIQGNYVLTSSGLTLLTDKEKDLLRFMKRYIKADGEEKKDPSGLKRFGLSLKRARVFELFELKKFGRPNVLNLRIYCN